HDLRPAFPGILTTIAAIEGHRGKNNLRIFFATDQMLQCFAGEEFSHRLQRAGAILHHFQSTVMSDVVMQRFHKTSKRFVSSTWRLALNSRPNTRDAKPTARF